MQEFGGAGLVLGKRSAHQLFGGDASRLGDFVRCCRVILDDCPGFGIGGPTSPALEVLGVEGFGAIQEVVAKVQYILEGAALLVSGVCMSNIEIDVLMASGEGVVESNEDEKDNDGLSDLDDDAS